MGMIMTVGMTNTGDNDDDSEDDGVDDDDEEEEEDGYDFNDDDKISIYDPHTLHPYLDEVKTFGLLIKIKS